jgi:hypothetical protein
MEKQFMVIIPRHISLLEVEGVQVIIDRTWVRDEPLSLPQSIWRKIGSNRINAKEESHMANLKEEVLSSFLHWFS